MHQALYRKWRPKTFREVYGQEHITSILQYEVKSGKTSHAYLFSGTRGTGKTSCAKILAKAVNCTNPDEDGNPCGVCDACRSIDNGTATDVLEMDAASNTGVDYIRDIKEAVVYTPSVLKKRVYIIDEVHMLSVSAFNALLKTLEEPPSHVMFILATTEQQKIPITILSRCQRFEFKRIRTSAITERINEIAKAEDISITDDAARLIARLAGGGMRDAVSLLELCAGSGEKIDADTVCSVAGASSRENIENMINAVENRDYEAIFSEISERYNSAQDLSVYFSDMLSYYRDILVVKRTKSPTDYMEIGKSDFERLKEIADRYPYEKLAYHSSLLEEAYLQMQRGISSKRLIAELTLVKMCDAKLDTSTEAILARIGALESGAVIAAPKKSSAAKSAESEKASDENSADKEQTNEKSDSEKPLNNVTSGLTAVKYWAEIVEQMKKYDMPSATFLNQAKAYFEAESGKFYIYLPNSFACMMINKESTHNALSGVLKQYNENVTGVEILQKPEEELHDSMDDFDE